MIPRLLTILVVDDSEYDELLMRTVFTRADLVQPLKFARDGEQAIAYLRGDGAHHDRRASPLPDAILLDLNMPRMNGFEVLAWIREQPLFQSLRIYILSASSRPEDIKRSYELGANAYFVKPGNLDGLGHFARTLVAWLKLNHIVPGSTANQTAYASDGDSRAR